MIGTLDVEIQAANPNMPLQPIRAFINSPTSVRLRNVPKKIGNWGLTSIQIVATYPDNTTKTANCVLVGGVWVGTIEGCSATGIVENGFTVFANGTDENGNAVNGYVLGKGLIQILDADSALKPDQPLKYVHLFNEEPTSPKDGDLYQVSGSWYIYQDGQAWPIGDDSGLISQLSDEVQTKVNQEQVESELSVKADLSSLSDYTTSADVSAIVTKRTQPIFGNWTVTPEVQGYWDIELGINNVWRLMISPDEYEPPIVTLYAIGEEDATTLIFDGSPAGINDFIATRPVTPSKNVLSLAMYEDLSDYATKDYVSAAIPTNLSSFNNDVGYITSSQVEPAGGIYPKWAQKAIYTTTVLNKKTTLAEADNLASLHIIDNVPFMQFVSYYPWILIYWNGTEFNPTVEIGNFGYYKNISVPFGPGSIGITINSYCWMNSDKVYFIKAEDVNGVFQPVQFGVRTNNTITWYNITLSGDKKSIASVEGTTGLTECIRLETYSTTNRNLAYSDEISAITDVIPTEATSSNKLADKEWVESELSDYTPLSSMSDYVTKDFFNQTIFDFGNGDVSAVAISGEINKTTMSDLGLFDSENEIWLKYPTSVRIGNSVTSLGIFAFSGCSSLQNIEIPFGVTYIDVAAFWDCRQLKHCQLPDSVTTIKDHAFNNCYALSSFTIPINVTEIENGTFDGCYELRHVVIPDGVTRIGNNAFENCQELLNINIPNSVSSIGEYAFHQCTNLKSVTIPDGVKTIGGSAFKYCEALPEVTVSDGVTSIGEDAFGGCAAMTKATIGSAVSAVEDGAFYETALTSVVVKGKQQAEAESLLSAASLPVSCEITTWNLATQEWVLSILQEYI